MLHYSHEGLIQRNTILGKVLAFGGLGILVVALVASLIRPASIGVILPVSLVGMAMSQAGSIYMTRWNRRGRADLLLDEGLKGLDGRFAACHFLLGTHHVLFGPPGVVALVPRSELGVVEYENDRWWITAFRKGHPHGKRKELIGLAEDSQSAVRKLERRLIKALPEHADWPITAVLVFIGDGTRVEAEGSPLPAVHVKKLKDLVRRLPRQPGPTEMDMAKLSATFPPSPAKKRP